MKKELLFLLVLLCSIALFAQDLSRPISLESTIYQDADDLYALLGMAKPSVNRPWTVGELELILSRVQGSCETSLERELFQNLAEQAQEQRRWISDDFGFSAFLDLNLELYAHTNSEDFVVDTDWVHGFDTRKSLVKARLEFSIYDFFYSYCDLQYGYSRGNIYDRYVYLDDSGLLSNGYVGSYLIDEESHMIIWSQQYSKPISSSFITTSDHFDFDWPKRSIISLGTDKWSLSFNRDRINLGSSSVGSMLLDDHRDYTDYLRFNVFSKSFKYDFITVFLNALSTKSEQMDNEARMVFIHLLEFRPLDNLTFTLSENVSAKFENPFNFSYINPAFIYHNLNNRDMFNAIAWVDLSWMPMTGLEIRGQFVMDQATAPNEDPNSQQSAIGYSLGSSYTYDLKNLIAKADIEYALTNPLLYRRDEVDFIYLRRSFHLDISQEKPDGYTGHHSSGDTIRFSSYATYFDFLGLKYGGDAQIFQAGYSLREPGKWALQTTFFFMNHGEFTIFSSHSTTGNNFKLPDVGGITPSGNITAKTLSVSLEATYSLSKLKYPESQFHLMADYVKLWDYQKDTKAVSNKRMDFQLTLGLSVTL